MKRTVLLGGVLCLAVLAGCGGTPGPSVAACKAVLKTGYAAALAHPGGKPEGKPAACKGLSAATLRKIVGQIMTGH